MKHSKFFVNAIKSDLMVVVFTRLSMTTQDSLLHSCRLAPLA